MMKNDQKNIKQVMNETPKASEGKIKSQHRDVDFLTEVLACMALTTKG